MKAHIRKPRHKSVPRALVLAFGVVLFFGAWLHPSPASALDMKFFPPSNLADCGSGITSILSWNGHDSVNCLTSAIGQNCPFGSFATGLGSANGLPTCVQLSTYLSICPPGSVLRGVDMGGNPICVVALTTSGCPANKVVIGVGNDGMPICAPALQGGCAVGMVVTGVNNGLLQCGSNTPSCPGGYAINSINPDSSANCAIIHPTPTPACPAGYFLQGIFGDGSANCIALPSCPTGYFVQSVNADGSAHCVAMPPAPSPQLGDPLFSKIITYTSTDPVYNLAQFNADMIAGIKALNGDWATNPDVQSMMTSCVVSPGSGDFPSGVTDTTKDYCGRFVCYSRNGILPFMNIRRDFCTGHDPNCGGGAWWAVYNCLNPS